MSGREFGNALPASALIELTPIDWEAGMKPQETPSRVLAYIALMTASVLLLLVQLT